MDKKPGQYLTRESTTMSSTNLDKKTSEESVEHLETQLDLNDNPQARIKNPLAGIPRPTLLRNVEKFAQEKELTHAVDILKKGAVRECPPAGASHISELMTPNSCTKPCRV